MKMNEKEEEKEKEEREEEEKEEEEEKKDTCRMVTNCNTVQEKEDKEEEEKENENLLCASQLSLMRCCSLGTRDPSQTDLRIVCVCPPPACWSC